MKDPINYSEWLSVTNKFNKISRNDVDRKKIINEKELP